MGYDRTTKTGTGLSGQYHEPNRSMYESRETCPRDLLLWFHAVPYTYRLDKGKTLAQYWYDIHWDAYSKVEEYQRRWRELEGRIDPHRFEHVLFKLEEQRKHAKYWRDAMNLVVFRFSGIADEKKRPHCS